MDELVNALHVIHEECKKYCYVGCYDCPMWSDEGQTCAVTDLEPYNWKINDHVQRALL